MTTIKAGQLHLVADGDNILLMHGLTATLASESETQEIRGTHVNLAPIQTLYSYNSSETTTLTVTSEYLSPPLADLIQSGILKRERKAVTVNAYKVITTNSSGTTTVTLPTDAVIKAVLYSDIGMEHMVIPPANLNTTTPGEVVISNELNKNIVLIYAISITGDVAEANAPSQNRVQSLVFSMEGVVQSPARTEKIIIPMITLTTRPEQALITDGKGEYTLEFSVLSGAGSPIQRISLDSDALTAMSL